MRSNRNVHLLLMCFFILIFTTVANGNPQRVSGNEFNPAISLILEGRYVSYDDDYELPGFQLGGEAGAYDRGFSTGHNELVISANVDNYFYGFFNAAIAYEDGESVIELEEAFIETLGLGEGITIKGGRFFSGIGYLNSIHAHAHDFADAPLVYAALMGNHILDNGLQFRWLAPTDLYLEIGLEVLSGSSYPGGSNADNDTGRAVFLKTGGDINVSSSWLAGISYYSTKFDVREGGGHAHGGDSEVDLEILKGESTITGLEFVYKWAPDGNAKQTNLKIQFEYFMRDENGRLEYADSIDSGAADYDGEQSGYYLQAVYQWMPRWRVGLRYDSLESDNTLGNEDTTPGLLTAEELGEETELVTSHKPQRTSLMVDFMPSEFSVLRLQYMRDESAETADNRLYLQFLMNLGSHGAHKF